MFQYNIKILKDTPFDKAYTILSPEAFRIKYSYLINTHNSDKFLADYLNGKYKEDHLDIELSDWFEVIETPMNNFKVGDWVWHEGEKKAYTTVVYKNDYQKEWRPNYASIEAVNNNPNTWKRLATKDEITYYDLHSFCEGQILIGQYKCYYFVNVWKDLICIHKNITKYLEYQKEFHGVSVLKQFSSDIESTWDCKPNGLKVGCKEIKHDDIIQIAKILKLG
jgi:hypothetical protein